MGTLTADATALSVEGPTDVSLSLTARTSSCLRYRMRAVTKGQAWLDLVTQVCNPIYSALQKARQDNPMIKTCLGYRGVSRPAWATQCNSISKYKVNRSLSM